MSLLEQFAALLKDSRSFAAETGQALCFSFPVPAAGQQQHLEWGQWSVVSGSVHHPLEAGKAPAFQSP